MDENIKRIMHENTLFHRTLQEAPLFVTFQNPEGIIEFSSKAMDDLYKDQFDTVVGLTCDDLYDETTRIKVSAANMEVYRTKEVRRDEMMMKLGKQLKVVDALRIPLMDDDKKVLGIVTLCIDISETSSIKDKLEQVSGLQSVIIDIASSFVNVHLSSFTQVVDKSLQKLGHAMNADRVYIFQYDFKNNVMDNTYEWCNEGVESEIDNLKGIPITDFLDGWVNVHRRNETVAIANVEALDKRSNLYQVLHPQGIKSLFTMPIYIGKECFGFLGFDAVKQQRNWTVVPEPLKIMPQLYSSLFHRYTILDELERVKDEAMSASAVKTEFLTKVTHEIRTPLNGIQNALYLLEETRLDEDQQQYTEILKLSHDTLNGLVDNILNYSQIEAKQMQHLPKDVLLEQELVKLIKVHKYIASNKEIGLYLDYDYSIPSKVSIDIEKVIQILSNLLHNGIKFTNYGNVKLQVSKIKDHAPYVDIEFAVVDTGIGISPDHLPHIFEEFYQVGDMLSKRDSGTGLGLTIANELTSFLKSKLTVKSKERRGSTFAFTLTMFVPETVETQLVPLNALLMKVTEGTTSNVQDMLESHIEQVELCTMQMKRALDYESYDIVFVTTNDARLYSQKLPDLKKKLALFPESVKKVLLIDGAKSPIMLDSFDLFDHHFEIPEATKTIIGYIRQDRVLSSSIFRRTDQDDEQGGKKSILLVDDNAVNRKAMAKVLEGMDLHVTEARHGYEALEIVQTKRFDLIFMDILMPGIDGYETTKRIRDLDTMASSVPIIAVTANDVESTRLKAFEFGMNGVLAKPLMKEDLNQLLNDYFAAAKPIQKKAKQSTISVFDELEFEQLYDENSTRIEIIEAFLEEQEQDMERIMDAFESESTEYIYKELHYFKGSFAYLKANKIYRLTQTILDLCNQNMLEEALMLKESFLGNYNQLIKELNEYITKK
jgi:signal transduction histidine kinase/PleD family two-component response regulator